MPRWSRYHTGRSRLASVTRKIEIKMVHTGQIPCLALSTDDWVREVVPSRRKSPMWVLGKHARRLAHRILATSAFGFLIAGCSVHPLPEDVTGLSTYNIVRQIRCET